MDLNSKMFFSHQTSDFWDRPIVFSPKRIVRVLTICVLVTLSLFTVLWIAPGGSSSRTLAPLQDKPADSTSHSSSQNKNVEESQYSPSEGTDLKEASYSTGKSSDLENYPYSSEGSDPKGVFTQGRHCLQQNYPAFAKFSVPRIQRNRSNIH